MNEIDELIKGMSHVDAAAIDGEIEECEERLAKLKQLRKLVGGAKPTKPKRGRPRGSKNAAAVVAEGVES